MDDFGMLARDIGFRPQGKSAPMSAPKGGPAPGRRPSPAPTKSAWNSTTAGGSHLSDDDPFFSSSTNSKRSDFGNLGGGYDDVFGGPPRYASPSPGPSAFDSLFPGSKESPKGSNLPVYDKPVYDDDIFEGVPGLKSSGSVKYEDVFSSMASVAENSSPSSASASQYDDLLGGFGKPETGRKRSGGAEKEVSGFDDLIPGFGGSSLPNNRETSGNNQHHSATVPSSKSSSNVLDDPFIVLESASAPAYSSSGLFSDPLENITKPTDSNNRKTVGSSAGGVFDDIGGFDGLRESVPIFSPEIDKNRKSKSPLRGGRDPSPLHMKEGIGNGPTEKVSANKFESVRHKKVPSDGSQGSPQDPFDIPAGLSNSSKAKATGKSDFHPEDSANADKVTSHHMSSKSDGNLETSDDVWLTVDEIPLFTQSTSAPPPSRPPPPLTVKRESVSKPVKGSSTGFNVGAKAGVSDTVRSSGVSSIDELEEFAMGKPRKYTDERVDIHSIEEEMMETNSAAAASAAAIKEAMHRAEAKFRQAREVRERERDAKTFKSRESPQREDEKGRQDAQERENRENQERLDRQREQREREEKEKEQKRLEREREREREIEREKARQAVERATKEARERAAAEARLRAERAAVQRAAAEARERAAAEARERAEKAAGEARERASAEARQKAATEARQKAAAEKAAAEARERAATEARLRAERAAVERAAAEARERAAAEARERAAAAAREKQQKNENDLESFFGMGSRSSSAPRQWASTSDPVFDSHFQSKVGSDGAHRTSVSSSSMRKASSATSFVDDLASVFGAATSAGEFQEVEGETEERRRARLERHQRTLERAKKALAEKNERDMQTQREQAERHRIAETLDFEIKRWAAGKDGNLRALLSTLQYVLWPECGWQPVSLTDLITAASVKKVYRKATLCIHPDKVQQKGANLQQKYIAEKVFDLLKEAWNKFNSEELF